MEAFSDGVLAIVITLLVLEIKVPQALPNDEAALWQAIAGQLPMIGAWVVSFLFVLVFWVAHHYFFDMLRKVDRGVLWLNGLFLLAICFMPFPTALSGQYPASRPATLLLSATMFVTALAFSAMRWYATFHAGLVAKEDILTREGAVQARAHIPIALFHQHCAGSLLSACRDRNPGSGARAVLLSRTQRARGRDAKSRGTFMSAEPTCLIIGAGSGNGLAIARMFGRKGFHLILASRGADRRSKLIAELELEGIVAKGIDVDCADPGTVFSEVAKLGPIDVLVYNVAAFTMAPPSSLDPKQVITDITVNAVSALAAAQAVIPEMKARGHGTILFTGGGFALSPSVALASLGMGKAALRNLAFSFHDELRLYGIRAGTVTILGEVKPGTPFDPGKIAEAFWLMHEDRTNSLGAEIQFSGET